MEKENVFVVEEKVLEAGIPKGITFYRDHVLYALEALKHGSFEDREITEQVETQFVRCRQVIPYVLLYNIDSFFSYFRTKKSGEKRLVGNCSIGIGGHISEVDGFDSNLVYNAVNRELNEELDITYLDYMDPQIGGIRIETVGVIFDDSDPVNSVHLGLVVLLDSKIKEIKRKEDHLEKCEWRTPDELKQLELESWSQFILEKSYYGKVFHLNKRIEKLYVGE